MITKEQCTKERAMLADFFSRPLDLIAPNSNKPDLEMRNKIIELLKSGKATRHIAKRLKVPQTRVGYYKRNLYLYLNPNPTTNQP